jgi:hypothetical protein
MTERLYDQVQLSAVLVVCASCQKAWYMTRQPDRKPPDTCIACHQQKKKLEQTKGPAHAD